MIFILLSICCSVTVAVLLKLARRYHINVLQAVMWNYLAAMVLSVICFKPDLSSLAGIPSNISLSLGVLLPLLFMVLSASIRSIGIVKTDISQRLSLFIPVVAALLVFHEHFNGFKIAGLLIGFAAIVLTLLRKNKDQAKDISYIFPVLVFVGFGVVDILFKQLALDKSIPYTSALLVIFCVAFFVALLIFLYNMMAGNQRLQMINFACGMILGCFNFGNILFYMKAHRAMADNPSTVFAAMNMGVIAAGTLIGVLLFKERISRLNYAGIFLALAAIVLITLSQRYAVR